MSTASPRFFDTHAHLDFPDYKDDLPQVIERARAAGITRINCIGTDAASSRRAIEIAEAFEGVTAVVGWHPGHVTSAPADFRDQLRELARHPRVSAIGETGLDYHRLPGSSGGTAADDERYKARQAELFRQHLEIAAELGLNCAIHQRDCFEETLVQLQPFASRVRGVFHCFAGDAAAARRVLSLNSLVSFTGIATFKNAQTVRDTVASLGLGEFMLETDCPYLAPVPYRGKRCEPVHVKEIARVIAEVKACSSAALSDATCAAAEAFFKYR